MAGLLAVLNNDQIDELREAVVAERYAAATGEDRTEQLILRLDAYVERCWQAAKNAKESKVGPEMLEDLRQRQGVYAPGKLAAIKEQGGSEIYMLLTNVKCRAAEGWIRDILLPAGDRPFTVRPSPVPDDLPDELKVGIYQRSLQELQQAVQSGLYVQPQQVYERSRALYEEAQQKLRNEAKTRAQRMEDAIDDVFVEGQWYEAMSDMIADLVCLPAGFIKGPVIRRNKVLKWGTDPRTGQSVPMAEDELTPMFYSPSPLDIYPAPNSRGIDDGYLCERISLRHDALYKMIGVPGYDETAIRKALDEYQYHGQTLAIAGDQQRRNIEHASQYQNSPETVLDAIEFHGSARGEWLIEWGMDQGEVPDEDAYYEVTCLKVGRHVVRCVLNEDPLGRRPYMKSCFDSIKGQFWGNGLSRILRDLQGICNAAARAMVNNMGIASGPFVEVEVDRLAEGEDPTQLYPWRMFQTKSSPTPSPAIRFFQTRDVTANLMQVYDYYARLASNYSGIPDYEQGINPTGGAAGTASGLSMLMTASSRQIKRVIAGIDAMIEGAATRVHTHLMLHGDDPDIKGDARIEARGAASLVAKEQQQIRRQQFMQASLNPIDSQIIGPMGRAEMLREALRSLDIDPDTVVPPKDEMMANMQAAQAQQAQQAAMQQAPQGGPPQPDAPLDPAGNPMGGQQAALFAGG